MRYDAYMNVCAQLEGKKVTVMRIGLLGRGVGDAAFLARNGAKVLVVDDAPQEAMQSSVDALKHYPNIAFKFGPYDLEDFRNCDFVLKGAGALLDSPEIEEAERAGVPVKMSASWFMELSGIPVVGVTGTRGKSTTTHMLHAIMQEAGMKVLNATGITARKNYAIYSADEFEKIWKQTDSTKKVPAVDFTKQYVIAVFAGVVPTGGYTISVSDVMDIGDARSVAIHIEKPGKGCVVTTAQSSPYQIVTVPLSGGSLSHTDTESEVDCHGE